MVNFDFLGEGLGIVSSTHFVYGFSKKMFLTLDSINWTKFRCLIASTFWDIGQYMYCNYLFPRLWRHRFWNWPYLSNQAVFLPDQKVQTKMQISWECKEFLGWNKKHFSSSLKRFDLSKMVSDLRVLNTLWFIKTVTDTSVFMMIEF